MADKVKEEKILIFGFLITIASYFLFSLKSNLFIIPAIIFLSLSLASIDGVKNVYIGKNISRENLATAQGTLNAFYGLGQLFSGLFGGFIWTKFGYHFAFLYGILMMIFGLVLLNFAFKGRLN